ncbi:MAG TPA: hypothetical protein DCP59_05075, partial [Megasphaera sp.]|nr:hypothetical protein [Megasphaera sp.]
AVQNGYWHLYRYNPDVEAAGKNGFSLDSKDPKGDLKDFLLGEVRYASLQKVFPEQAEQFYERTEKDMKDRLDSYKKLADRK